MTTEATGANGASGAAKTGKRGTLSKPVRRAVYESAGGCCHVCGDKKEPLASDWHVITDASVAAQEPAAPGEQPTHSALYVICSDCKRQLGGLTLEQLRAELVKRLAAARALVGRYGSLTGASVAELAAAAEAEQTPRITFAGEARAEAAAAKSAAPKAPRNARGPRATRQTGPGLPPPPTAAQSSSGPSTTALPATTPTA